jgi:hypothetical protein
MTNTSAMLFTDTAEASRMKKQRAELYTRIYQYAAEDFVSTADFQQFMTTLVTWCGLVESQLATLMQILSTHVHQITPHVHPIEPHTHIDGDGRSTSPNIGAVATLPVPLTTIIPNTSSGIVWKANIKPSYINTTLAIPNIEGNKIIVGVGSDGDAYPDNRRLKLPPILLQPTIPPIITNGLKSLA